MPAEDRTTERAERMVDRAREIYGDHGKVFQAVWVVAGVVVLLAGLAMTVLPGPAAIVVPAGLAMLAVVFGWARRLLIGSIRRSVQAKHGVEAASTKAKVFGGLALACLAAAVGTAAWFAWAGS